MTPTPAPAVVLEADLDETTPLLVSTRHEHPQDSNSPSERRSSRVNHRLWPYAAILCGALSLVADLGDGLTAAPEVRLLEMAVCRDYYHEHDPRLIGPPPLSYVREELCKRDEIQVELAYLRALKGLFAAVPGLFCTVLFGRLADHWGRKPILLLGMTGQILTYLWVIMICYFHEVFPTRLIWASAVFQLMGGGHRNISALMNTVIVDVAPENARTSTFYLVGALIRITDMLSAGAGSYLLSHDLWLPFKISTPILLTSLPIILTLPETAPPRTPLPPRPRHDSLVPESPTKPHRPATTTTMTTTTSLLHSFPPPLLLTLLTITLKTFALMSAHTTLQFASRALRIPLASAGYLLSLKALVSLLVLVLLPAAGAAATSRRGVAPVAVDVWVARGSLAALAAGSLVVGAASAAAGAGAGHGAGAGALGLPLALVVGGLVVGSAGNGITQTMRGLVAHFGKGWEGRRGRRNERGAGGGGGRDEGGDEGGPGGEGTGSRMGQLYAGVALLELIAVLTGEMAFAWLFALGIRLSSSEGDGGMRSGWESGWLGLPFYAAGVTFFLGLACAAKIPTMSTTQGD
ncbi:mfs transporter [Diplodia corticola]|uniref:Mfs transporter n=1 Tax=Diplodia corticola TaxID=236234 RepID=A0A1J9RYS4_9PEZI|nr:mfs transporter [Diplodia corticola]OJD32597.1 mfs transporter [Diplodia corticola]